MTSAAAQSRAGSLRRMLVPLALAQPAVERLAGDDFTEEIVSGAKHETFNEFDRRQTIELVAGFAERVTAR